METLFFYRTPSPVGPLFLAASEKGLVRLEFEARTMKMDPRLELRESKQALAPYLCELNEYFRGERRDFSIPLDLRGTPFQLACWQALLEIPYGVTCSYGDIAHLPRYAFSPGDFLKRPAPQQAIKILESVKRDINRDWDCNGAINAWQHGTTPSE